jgi:intergrase/recombinase
VAGQQNQGAVNRDKDKIMAEIKTEYAGYAIIYKEYGDQWVAMDDGSEVLSKDSLSRLKEAIDAREKRKQSKGVSKAAYVPVYFKCSYEPPILGKTRIVKESYGGKVAVFIGPDGKRREERLFNLASDCPENRTKVEIITGKWAVVAKLKEEIADIEYSLEPADLSGLVLD